MNQAINYPRTKGNICPVSNEQIKHNGALLNQFAEIMKSLRPEERAKIAISFYSRRKHDR